MSTLNPQHPGLCMWQMKYARKKFIKTGKTKKNSLVYCYCVLYVISSGFLGYRRFELLH